MADSDRCDILGRSNAAVYRAVKRGDAERVFAAKVYSNDGQDPCRLEYELLKRLDHAVIPKVHAFYAGHRESAFVMDYAPGQNLEVLKRKGLLTVENVLHVGERTCAALAYAHGQHVYHHDVACDNIMFDAATGKVCLLDWNYACAADYSHQTPNVSGLSPSRWTTKAEQEQDLRDAPSHESLPCSENTTSLSWEQYGKPLYRAPAGEEGRIDEQDVYALGVVLQRGLKHLDVDSEVEAWLAMLLAPPPARVSAQVALDSLRALRR
jgi:serine/threonine protein kinase